MSKLPYTPGLLGAHSDWITLSVFDHSSCGGTWCVVWGGWYGGLYGGLCGELYVVGPPKPKNQNKESLGSVGGGTGSPVRRVVR